MSDVDAQQTPPARRLGWVVGFTAACVGIFGFLWTNSGGTVPLVDRGGYTVVAEVPRAANVVYFSDVMVAGVKVGKVVEVAEQGDGARIVMELDEQAAPLHEGALVRIGAKSLVEESYVEITDGEGAELASGDALPADAAQEVVQLDDVLRSLDEPTRAELSQTLVSLGATTADSQQAVADAVTGLGHLGREGEDVLGALAAQSDSLTTLSGNATELLAALSSRQAQVAQLVASADEVTRATAGQSEQLAATVESLPGLLESAGAASDDLVAVSTALTPVATHLRAAAPHLTAALTELPATAASLRGLLPDLDTVLVSAPATLDQVPALTTDIDALLPQGEGLLADLNPVLGYLEPYGQDVAAWFTNFAQTIALGDVNGKAFRVMPVLDEQSLRGYPVTTNDVLDRFNPLPAPGSLDDPDLWAGGDYPRVEREAVPE